MEQLQLGAAVGASTQVGGLKHWNLTPPLPSLHAGPCCSRIQLDCTGTQERGSSPGELEQIVWRRDCRDRGGRCDHRWPCMACHRADTAQAQVGTTTRCWDTTQTEDGGRPSLYASMLMLSNPLLVGGYRNPCVGSSGTDGVPQAPSKQSTNSAEDLV